MSSHEASPEARSEFPTVADIEAWLISHVAELAAIDPKEIDTRKPFTYYGLSSAEGVLLAGDLGEWLGRFVEATLAWDYPTIEALARYLADEASSTEDT